MWTPKCQSLHVYFLGFTILMIVTLCCTVNGGLYHQAQFFWSEFHSSHLHVTLVVTVAYFLFVESRCFHVRHPTALWQHILLCLQQVNMLFFLQNSNFSNVFLLFKSCFMLSNLLWSKKRIQFPDLVVDDSADSATAIAVGVTVPLVLLLVIGAVVGVIIYRRKFYNK